MLKKTALLATLTASVLVTGCAHHSTKMDDWWRCALAGGVVGGAGGSMDSSDSAAYGALGGALVGGVICALSANRSPSEISCPVMVPGWDVEKNGCPKDSDGDGVPDVLDQCPGTPPGARVDAKGCPILRKVVLEPVLFESSSADLSGYARTMLTKEADFLNKYPHSMIRISGFADATGPKAFNQELSEKRAFTARAFLIDKGVHPSRISVHGYGADNPAANNKTKHGRQTNRRVETEMHSDAGE